MIRAYILIQTEVGKIAAVTASARTVPGILETASLVGPYDVVARAQAQDTDELAKLVTSKIQTLDGVTRTVSCAVAQAVDRAAVGATPRQPFGIIGFSFRPVPNG